LAAARASASGQRHQREIDLYIQRQLRVENAGASYADTRANMYSQLQDIYGQPGADTSLEAVYNSFTSALQVLSTSPDDPGARTAVVNSAQLLTQQLNQLSGNIQSLRANAELGIADAVNKANEAMTQIASLNGQIAAGTPVTPRPRRCRINATRISINCRS
jgi:flagellar hook-associated protein 1 FlgK